MPLSPRVGLKMTSEASVVRFPPTFRKRSVTALRGIAPTGAFPVGATSLVVVGSRKGLFG